jgi:hypothetical protein
MEASNHTWVALLELYQNLYLILVTVEQWSWPWPVNFSEFTLNGSGFPKRKMYGIRS